MSGVRVPAEPLDDLGVVEPVEPALAAVLERHPRALVVACAGEGSPQMVEVPGDLPLAGQHPLPAVRNLLDEVVPADRVVVAKLWAQARSSGLAVAPVRLQCAPESPSDLYFLDLRPRYGVLVAVYAVGSPPSADATLDAGPMPLHAPRLARVSKDASAVLRTVDDAFTRILGWKPDEILGRRIAEIVHPDDVELAIAAWVDMLDAPGEAHPVRLRHRRRDGSWVWMQVVNHNRLDDPAHRDVMAEMVDISEEMTAVETLRAREQLLVQLTETVPVGLFHVDEEGRVAFANRRLLEITGGRAEPSLEALLGSTMPEDRPALERAVDEAHRGAEVDVEVRMLPPDDGVRHCTIRIRPLRGEDGEVTGLTGCVEDVTVAVRTLAELQAKAVSDQLTGCVNRSATLAVLQELLDSVPSGRPRVAPGTAVIFMDLDGFKPVNDRLGHAVGDELLRRVAERLRDSVRSGDVVGRWGGDEFVVVCPGVRSRDHALTLAWSLAERALGQGFEVSGSAVAIRASMGVAWTDFAGMHASVLVDQADSAMYGSKREGRGTPVLFSGASSLPRI